MISPFFRLARDPGAVARRVLQLKVFLPGANASLMIANRPALVLDDDLELFRRRTEAIRQELPGVRVDLMIQARPLLPFFPCLSEPDRLRSCRCGQDFPALLEIRDMAATVAHVSSSFGLPGLPEVIDLVRRDPNVLLMAQRGQGLIPYDDPSPQDDDYEGYTP